MLMMLYYDFWQEPKKFETLEEGIKYIGQNRLLVNEMEQVIKLLIDKINYLENDLNLPYLCPIKIHSRYTRVLRRMNLATQTHKHLAS